MYITAKIDGKEVKPLTSVRQRSIAWDHTRSVQAFQSKSYGYTPVGSKVISLHLLQLLLVQCCLTITTV